MFQDFLASYAGNPLNLERSTRLELALRAWKALVLPLHHDRIMSGFIAGFHA